MCRKSGEPLSRRLSELLLTPAITTAKSARNESQWEEEEEDLHLQQTKHSSPCAQNPDHIVR